MFDRHAYKDAAKLQVSNVIIIFLIFIFINFIISALSGANTYLGTFSDLIRGNYQYYYSYPKVASSIFGGGFALWITSIIIRCVEPYFESKACLFSSRHERKAEVSVIFGSSSWDEFFSYFFKQLIANLIIGAIIAAGVIVALIFVSVGYASQYAYSSSYTNTLSISGFAIFMVIATFIATGVIAIVMQYRYIFVKYIALDQPQLGIMDTLKLSAQSVKGYKTDLFIMSLSFIGWFLLVMITLGLASIYVNPYYELAYAEAYRSLMPEDTPKYDFTSSSDAQPEQPEKAEETTVETKAPEETESNTDSTEKPSEKKFCPNCGEEVDPDTNFCTHCGAKLK